MHEKAKMDQRSKITYHSSAKEISTYIRLPLNYTILKKDVEKYLFEERKQPCCEIRIFWIDGDNDEIEIVNNGDYQIFMEECSGGHQLHAAPIDMIVEAPDATNITSTASASNKAEIPPAAGFYDYAVHDYIKCDSCLMLPIIGFRYKCVRCPEYDLCQNCESKHMHSEHMMVRLPTKDFSSDVRDYCTGLRKSATSLRTTTSTTAPQKTTNATISSNNENPITAVVTATAARVAAKEAHQTPVKAVVHETAIIAAKNVDATTSPCDPELQPDAVPVTPSPSLDLTQFLDPQYMKTSIQILNNFSDMFANMLDAMESAEGNQNPKLSNLRKNSESSNKSSVSSNLNSLRSDKKSDEEESIEKDQSQEKTRENQSQQKRKENQSDNNNSAQVEIDDNPERDQNLTFSNLRKNSESSNKSSVSSNLNSLRSDKKSDEEESIEKDQSQEKTRGNQNQQKRKENQSDNNNSAEVEIDDNPDEESVAIVNHADSRIDNAVTTMLSMGFTNKIYLKKLLECVNGNIPEALEFFSPVGW